MRNIVNISMPAEMKKEIEICMKEGNYASTSEFLRDAFRVWKRSKLLGELRESQNDFKNGRYKVLKSLKDLD